MRNECPTNVKSTFYFEFLDRLGAIVAGATEIVEEFDAATISKPSSSYQICCVKLRTILEMRNYYSSFKLIPVTNFPRDSGSFTPTRILIDMFFENLLVFDYNASNARVSRQEERVGYVSFDSIYEFCPNLGSHFSFSQKNVAPGEDE